MSSIGDRLGNLWWETRLGIATRGVAPVDHPDAAHYATMAYSSIWPVLRHLALGRQDVFVDIGSGKGRVLCCAARLPVDRVIGVDLSPERTAEATENVRRLRGRHAPIEAVTALAQEYDYSDVTAVFLFDPFGADTLNAVLERIAKDRAGRPVRFAYANATLDSVFRAQTWLEPGEFWRRAETGLEHDVAFYRSRDTN
ncbi:MAG TPA: class I SAM-dependent methyltransferase [Rugosimonospora sp.]|nr:class I SAM-dependent methyltransferase [Rugosimonospora sp.]